MKNRHQRRVEKAVQRKGTPKQEKESSLPKLSMTQAQQIKKREDSLLQLKAAHSDAIRQADQLKQQVEQYGQQLQQFIASQIQGLGISMNEPNVRWRVNTDTGEVVKDVQATGGQLMEKVSKVIKVKDEETTETNGKEESDDNGADSQSDNPEEDSPQEAAAPAN